MHNNCGLDGRARAGWSLRSPARLGGWRRVALLLAAFASAGAASLTGADGSAPEANAAWRTASSGGEAALLGSLRATAPSGSDDTLWSPALLDANLTQREAERAEQTAKARADMAEHMAKADAATDPQMRDVELSRALGEVVSLEVLVPEQNRAALRAALLAEPDIRRVIERSDKAARDAEARGDWLLASDLVVRLDALYENEATYREDMERLGRRLSMIRLYAPERLWQLRNQRRVLEGEDAFPAYNPYGDTYQEKIAPINQRMVIAAVQHSAFRHVENNADSLRALILSGLTALETFATTTDLHAVFAGLADEGQRAEFLRVVDGIKRDIADPRKPVGLPQLDFAVDRALSVNRYTVQVPPEALLHEFGNGAMGALDEYTAVIWPDEIKRFERDTKGRFVGVGIQIEMDTAQNIRVVTPLDGKPAQIAGVQAKDIITKVNGQSILGFTLDQAVEVITGPENTSVTITIARYPLKDDGEPDLEAEPKTLDLLIKREEIDLPSVKGWRKTGPGDMDWDWFIDREAGIGYLRLTKFSEQSTEEFDAAVEQMRAQGLSGLILDLRFNPGGLLDQAVKIANRFVDEGLIVKTVDAQGATGQREFARPLPPARRLDDVPVVILINRGSASASEIVSGAIQAHAHDGNADAIIIGQRSFGKGSVQNVFPLDQTGRAAMKLTTQYYKLHGDRTIHRRPGAVEWGVEPDLAIDMLPEQIIESARIRRDADLYLLDENGNHIQDAKIPDPNELITGGDDLQLQAAVALLGNRVAAGEVVTDAGGAVPKTP